LSEYDIRRPMVRTGTNLLGLIKHVASVEAGYFGATFDRPFEPPMPWWDDDAEPNADMWATPDESRAYIVDFYKQVWAHSNATIDGHDLESIGRVPWWPADRNEVSLHRVLIHVIAETDRHAGHADVVRELIDGGAGRKSLGENMPPGDEEWWQSYRSKVEAAARAAGSAAADGG
jgi:Protein of unknown function (DUF664)